MRSPLAGNGSHARVGKAAHHDFRILAKRNKFRFQVKHPDMRRVSRMLA